MDQFKVGFDFESSQRVTKLNTPGSHLECGFDKFSSQNSQSGWTTRVVSNYDADWCNDGSLNGIYVDYLFFWSAGMFHFYSLGISVVR